MLYILHTSCVLGRAARHAMPCHAMPRFMTWHGGMQALAYNCLFNATLPPDHCQLSFACRIQIPLSISFYKLSLAFIFLGNLAKAYTSFDKRMNRGYFDHWGPKSPYATDTVL